MLIVLKHCFADCTETLFCKRAAAYRKDVFVLAKVRLKLQSLPSTPEDTAWPETAQTRVHVYVVKGAAHGKSYPASREPSSFSGVTSKTSETHRDEIHFLKFILKIPRGKTLNDLIKGHYSGTLHGRESGPPTASQSGDRIIRTSESVVVRPKR